MELVQGDARDGVWLPDPDKPEKAKKTYRFGWVDNYSRKILVARYYWDEKLPRIEDSFKTMVLRWGIPKKAYLDYAEEKRMPKLECVSMTGRELALRTLNSLLLSAMRSTASRGFFSLARSQGTQHCPLQHSPLLGLMRKTRTVRRLNRAEPPGLADGGRGTEVLLRFDALPPSTRHRRRGVGAER